MWYLFRRKISLCLKDSTGDLLICPREQDLSRYPELHFLFPGVLPGFLPFCQLHTCICLHRSHPVWKVQRFPGLLLKKRGQRINMDRLDILPGSRRLSDAFCRKKFPHSRGSLLKPPAIDPHCGPSRRILLYGHAGVPSFHRLFSDKIPHFLQLSRKLVEMPHCAHVHLLLQCRDNVMADPVTCIFILLIGRIPAETDLPAFQPFLDFHSSEAQKRADPPFPHRTDAAQPVQSCPPRQVQQHCLRIVILMMRRRDLRSAVLSAHGLKRLAPHHTPRLFKRLFPFSGS